jgi:hypothetical protein
MASSVAGSNSYGFFFLCGHLEEKVHAVPPRIIEDPVPRLQTSVTAVDANVLRRVRENAARRAAVYVETNGAA